jgi:urea transport system substrate-binding protein
MIQKKALISLLLLLSIGLIIGMYIFFVPTQQTIKVGILHSLTGTMAQYEKPVVDATMLAIEEINNNGGILGKKIQPIIKDGKSESSNFAQQAENLIIKDKVAALFGCWTSQDRKAVKPIVEHYNSLLFYPVQNEGLEDSPNIVYTSTIPNQQAIPAVTWCLQNLGNRFFLVGTDELFPRATNEILKDTIALFNGTVVAEEYLSEEHNDIDSLVQKIIKTQPQVIINTIIGSDNIVLFTKMRQAGITSEKIPTMSLCIDESDLERFNIDYLIGDYSCWSHFQSIERIENKQFVEKLYKKYGKNFDISDAVEAAYFGVYLWKQAVIKAQTINTANVQVALKNQAFDAPEGIIHVDDTTLHTWSVSSVGKIRSDKQFTILWNSMRALRPMVYPFFKTQAEWNALLDQWYKQWGNRWSKI